MLLTVRSRSGESLFPPWAVESHVHRQSQDQTLGLGEAQLFQPGMSPFQGVLVCPKRADTSSQAVVKVPSPVLTMDKATAGSRNSSIQDQVSPQTADQQQNFPERPTRKNRQSVLPALRQFEQPWPSPESPLHLIFLFRHRPHCGCVREREREWPQRTWEYPLQLGPDVAGGCATCHPAQQQG